MSWRWRKSIRTGPFRINLTKKGIGYSVGIPGLRYGRSPSGKKYVSQSIPGTGLYRIKYLGAKARGRAALPPQTTVGTPTPATPVSVPSGPSPLAIGARRAVAVGIQLLAAMLRALARVLTAALAWSRDQIATARLRRQAQGWVPPSAPATPPAVAPPTVASSAPSQPQTWLPSPTTNVTPAPPAAAPTPPPGVAVPPPDPWWKQKPSP